MASTRRLAAMNKMMGNIDEMPEVRCVALGRVGGVDGEVGDHVALPRSAGQMGGDPLA